MCIRDRGKDDKMFDRDSYARKFTDMMSEGFISVSYTHLLLGLISSIYYLKGMMYLFGIGAVVILLMFFPQVRASAFKALMFIVMTFSREISSYKLILYSLAFSLGCYIIMYLIARISQVKR